MMSSPLTRLAVSTAVSLLGSQRNNRRPHEHRSPEISLASALAVLLLAAGSAPSAAAGAAEGDPVVVELFTSQGCSSCPPADRLLSRLGGEGAAVIPLAFHVDYWNYIGWTDPFSSPVWSERQRGYAKALGTGRIYTPQLVVGGRSDCVGSDESEVRKQIERARSEPAAGEIELEVRAGTSPRSLALEITVRLRREVPGSGLLVMVAVVENDLVTPVARGENSGRTLRNNHVVRSLSEAFRVPAAAGGERSGSLQIDLADGWQEPNLTLVAFLQDPASRHIHAAASTPLSP